MSKWRRVDVDATSPRRIDVSTTSFKPDVCLLDARNLEGEKLRFIG